MGFFLSAMGQATEMVSTFYDKCIFLKWDGLPAYPMTLSVLNIQHSAQEADMQIL
jgi:hypothetical protein